jgi:predicted  nucleic acid-binding Zn-ribbon protein
VQGRHAHFERMQGQERLKKLKAKHAALLAKVSVLESLWLEEQQSVFAFASARQKAQLMHLERVVPLVKDLQQVNTPTRNLSQYKERWRRSRGVMLWQMYEQEPARSFFADQGFFELAQTLDSLHEQLAHSETALAWAAMGYQGLEARITHELSRVQALQAQVKEIQQSQEEALFVQMTDTLNAQKNQLLGYQAQARLALARLYDDALQTQLAASKGGEQ